MHLARHNCRSLHCSHPGAHALAPSLDHHYSYISATPPQIVYLASEHIRSAHFFKLIVFIMLNHALWRSTHFQNFPLIIILNPPFSSLTPSPLPLLSVQLSRAFSPYVSGRGREQPNTTLGTVTAPSFHPMDVVEHPNHYSITAGVHLACKSEGCVQSGLVYFVLFVWLLWSCLLSLYNQLQAHLFPAGLLLLPLVPLASPGWLCLFPLCKSTAIRYPVA